MSLWGDVSAEPDTGELMTRRQVAAMFGATSAAVAAWARAGKLAEVRDEDGRPRYRPADVEALYARRLDGQGAPG